MSPITLSENSVEKMQVFWPWSSFRMSACTVPRTFSFTQAAMPAASSALGSRLFSAWNASRFWSIAVLMNIARIVRSEEHTSELQSLAYLVCRLLLEKKKKKKNYINENKKTKKRRQILIK